MRAMAIEMPSSTQTLLAAIVYSPSAIATSTGISGVAVNRSATRFRPSAATPSRPLSAAGLVERGQEVIERPCIEHVARFEPRPARLRDAPVKVVELVQVMGVRVDDKA